ncbi:sensor histidine kinase [Arenimonas daejeonensis]|uniref:sensor histidine kinase n=1 Tax=Arenimonas daejeonensis TaxID=370777 RepID=UPI0011BE4A88|nr:sensor histidine kinase [Arenimonas daejeonensis]
MATITGPAQVDRNDIHDNPWVTLVYLFFVFVPLVFYPRAAGWPLLASLVAIAVFLPLHFRYYRTGPADRAPLVFAVAAIGYLLIPINAGGQTFLIYACAMCAWAFPPQRAVMVASLLLAIMVAEFFHVMPTLRLALGWSGMAVLIAGMVLTGTLFARAKARRDAELRLTQDEVGRLAAMAERERIGRDLHDLLGHTLSLVAIKSELAGRLVDRDPTAAKAQIGEVETVARQALAQVREAVVGIRATGLQAELAAARLALLSADVRLDQRLAPVAPTPAAESVLALGLREAVTNVLRHAGAGRVEVELSARDGGLCLAISDDGRGGAGTTGNGLLGMRERLATLGGTLEIESPPGGGTRLLLKLPPAALEGPSP